MEWEKNWWYERKYPFSYCIFSLYASEITVKLCGYCNYLLFMARRYSAVEGQEGEGILQKLLWELPFYIFVLYSKMFICSCLTG